MIKIFILFISLCVSSNIFAKEIIKVGVYEFKPYYAPKDAKDLIRETIRLLNENQNEYDFKLFPIPAKRRYDSITNNTVDMVFYEDLSWGWKKVNVHFHPLPVTDGEVFFSRNSRKKTDEYFKTLNNKTIAVIMGYHYSFTSFQDFEGKKFLFNLTSAKDAEQVMDITLSGRADMGVLANSYLRYSAKTNKHFQNTLAISNIYDHHYKLGIIHGAHSKISNEKMALIVENLRQSTSYLALLKSIGLTK